jgi:two-component system phosphate regulon sensor histidine kinase PhoR
LLATYDIINLVSNETSSHAISLLIPSGETILLDSFALKSAINLKYGNSFDIFLQKSNTDSNLFTFRIEPGLEQKLKNENEYRSRKRAYYSEAIFFMVLLFLGFIWIFKSLERVLNLNRLQRNFMMSVTHELKTPVATLKLATQTLAKRTLSAEQTQTLVQKVHDNANRLDKLIEGMLVAVKIERKTLETAFNKVSVLRLLNEITNELKENAPFEGNIHIAVDPSFEVWGDEVSLKIAFSNIIDNAIKYAGGAVQLEISSEGKSLRFADQGPGIPLNERRKIFRQFYRIGNEDERVAQGTGMGLYLVKNVLQIHKAKIYVTPNKPNGTIFSIKF